MKRIQDPKTNPENRRSIFFELGLLVALSASLVAFEWKSFYNEAVVLQPIPIENIEDDIIPITYTKKSTPKPPHPFILIKQIS